MPNKIGMRALTMQQPFAAAMAHGVGLYSRRGRATKFGNQAKHTAGERLLGPGGEGEWLAIHCGRNNEHLNNKPLMQRVRKHWPACPPDAELRATQQCIVGAALFVDGAVPGPVASKACAVLREYPCAKPVAWRAAEARALPTPVQYPKGQVQVWHVYEEGFVGGGRADAKALRKVAMAPGAAAAVPTKQKQEQQQQATALSSRRRGVKTEEAVMAGSRAAAGDAAQDEAAASAAAVKEEGEQWQTKALEAAEAAMAGALAAAEAAQGLLQQAATADEAEGTCAADVAAEAALGDALAAANTAMAELEEASAAAAAPGAVSQKKRKTTATAGGRGRGHRGAAPGAATAAATTAAAASKKRLRR